MNPLPNIASHRISVPDIVTTENPSAEVNPPKTLSTDTIDVVEVAVPPSQLIEDCIRIGDHVYVAIWCVRDS